MKKRGRIDANHAAIVRELRRVGLSVCSTANLGGGFPDIIVGARGRNYLFEIKPDIKNYHLTDEEKTFHLTWDGQVHVIRNYMDALKIINRDFPEMNPEHQEQSLPGGRTIPF